MSVLVLCLAACSSEANKDAGSSGTGQSAGLKSTVALLDQTLASYGNCLAQHFKVTLRYRADRFSGIQMDLKPLDGGQVDADEAAQGDKWMSDCSAKSNVDSVASAHLQAFPLNDGQNKAIATEYVDCMRPLLPTNNQALLSVANRDDVLKFQSDLSKQNPSDATAAQECFYNAVYGPKQEF